MRRFNNDEASKIPVQAYAADGSERTIRIKPRNKQDAIFYSQPNAGLRNPAGTSGQ